MNEMLIESGSLKGHLQIVLSAWSSDIPLCWRVVINLDC